MAREVAILRWTGRGKISDLLASVQRVLRDRRLRVVVRVLGGSLVLRGEEPVGLCTTFENMPGVAWAAAGFSVSGRGEVARASSLLASRYLGRGTRFSVGAEVTGKGTASDLAGTVTSTMLGRVKGSRATNDLASVKVRAALDGTEGVVGVEISPGPGGTPMGEAGVVCLVSGGKHSSVLAWYSLLQGFRVRLVHAASGEDGLLASARLYAELSNRGDPSGVTLTVLDGGDVAGLLRRFVRQCAEPTFAGFTVGSSRPTALGERVKSPLYMLPEESFEAQFGALGLRSFDRGTKWGARLVGEYSERTFGGKRADVSEVIDGL